MSLGDCSYLDTCRHMKTCKFVHYEIDDSTTTADSKPTTTSLFKDTLPTTPYVVCLFA